VNDELERAIRAAAEAMPYPETPDIEQDVIARIRAVPRTRALRWPGLRPNPKRVAIAFAVLVVAAVGAVAAVPSARSAVLRFFHLGGIELERVDRLPAVTPTGPLGLGRETTLAEARRLVGFDVVVPRLRVRTRIFVRLPQPVGRYAPSSPPGGQVSFLVGSLQHPRLLLTEFRAHGTRKYAEKLIGRGTSVEFVDVNGATGIWVQGHPHLFHFVQPDGGTNFEPLRLAGNTLIWERMGLTLRLEAHIEKQQALAIASTVK
jgi:hypothetical protein